MADFITQIEADALVRMEKHDASGVPWIFPDPGMKILVPLVSADGRELFSLDVGRGRADLMRGKNQVRARKTVPLVRLDFGAAPHRNPDDETVLCPHLHIYREGYGLKWAISVPEDAFPDMSSLTIILDSFMRYCNITKPPTIHGRLNR